LYSVYNRRKRRLSFKINEIRQKLARNFLEFEDCFVVDSMPMEVCNISRSHSSTICSEQTYCAPNRGYCASQQMSFLRLQTPYGCSVSGVFHSVDVSPASVHNIHFFKGC